MLLRGKGKTSYVQTGGGLSDGDSKRKKINVSATKCPLLDISLVFLPLWEYFICTYREKMIISGRYLSSTAEPCARFHSGHLNESRSVPGGRQLVGQAANLPFEYAGRLTQKKTHFQLSSRGVSTGV